MMKEHPLNLTVSDSLLISLSEMYEIVFSLSLVLSTANQLFTFLGFRSQLLRESSRNSSEADQVTD